MAGSRLDDFRYVQEDLRGPAGALRNRGLRHSYCTALVWNVEVQELTLSDPAAEAAFRFARVCSSGGGGWSMTEEDEGGEEEKNQVMLEWDEPETKFPDELACTCTYGRVSSLVRGILISRAG